MGSLIVGVSFSEDAMGGGLQNAIEMLPSVAKIAMYKAASARTIRQHTWDRCAFNAAGVVVGNGGIQSYAEAAKTFNCSLYVVTNFVQAWDSFQSPDDQDPTEHLKIMLEKSGLFVSHTDKIKVIDKEAQDQFIETLEQEFSLDDLDLEACKLLFAGERQ